MDSTRQPPSGCARLVVVALAVGMGAGDSWACPGTESCSLSQSGSVSVNCTLDGEFIFETTAEWAVPTDPVPIVIVRPNSAGGNINIAGGGAAYNPSFVTSADCEGSFEITVTGKLANHCNNGVVNSELVVNPTILECYASDATFIPRCNPCT